MPPWDRSRYWSIVVIIAERVKQDELQRGLDRFGRKLRPVKVRKVKFRRSGRVVDGEPLMPHRGLSRTRRLLRYTVTSIGVLFFWGNGWARILDMHRRRGVPEAERQDRNKLPVRDVFGISPIGNGADQGRSGPSLRNGTMPEKKIAGNMADSGVWYRTAVRQHGHEAGQGARQGETDRPVDAVRFSGGKRERRSLECTDADGEHGNGNQKAADTGLEIGTTFKKGFKFAK